MNVNKKFIKKLAEDKFSKIGEIVLDLKVVKKVGGSLVNVFQNLEEFESIFYTVEFLIENNLIEMGQLYYDGTTFPITSTLEDPSGDELVTLGKIRVINKYLDKYWGQEIFVKPGIYKYIGNGFKTDEEKDKNDQFRNGIIIACVTSFLTAVFTYFFSVSSC